MTDDDLNEMVPLVIRHATSDHRFTLKGPFCDPDNKDASRFYLDFWGWDCPQSTAVVELSKSKMREMTATEVVDYVTAAAKEACHDEGD